MKAQFIYEKFNDKNDPIKDIGIGMNLYKQYLDVLNKNPQLKIFYKGKQIFHFKESSETPKEIFVNWNKEHPMSGYGGRKSWMRFWGSIKYIKGKYRVRCFMVEDSGPSEKYHKEFDTMEEALNFVISDFQSLLSYYGDDYTFGK
jgi:hypothetical protein